jgi:hypothetical protein
MSEEMGFDPYKLAGISGGSSSSVMKVAGSGRKYQPVAKIGTSTLLLNFALEPYKGKDKKGKPYMAIALFMRGMETPAPYGENTQKFKAWGFRKVTVGSKEEARTDKRWFPLISAPCSPFDIYQAFVSQGEMKDDGTGGGMYTVVINKVLELLKDDSAELLIGETGLRMLLEQVIEPLSDTAPKYLAGDGVMLIEHGED